MEGMPYFRWPLIFVAAQREIGHRITLAVSITSDKDYSALLGELS